ncbi:hypothetical protein [Hymenobacter sp. BT190]|uniref:hypothetical protein n=1 Tax=Hymenobacter sp. BT190 TaxID=2763505 RepID=UPI0016512BF2|nr:hypothetical protein [Hymenobacter sp. BT190]MBC6698447.1 hypothetical protein [Hymenobacter sp. BT190]
MKTLLLSFAAAVLLATSATAAPFASRSDDDRWERKYERDHDHDKGSKKDKRYGKKDKDKKYQDRRDYDNRRDDKCQRDGRYSRDEQNRRNDGYGYGNRRREPAPVLKRFPGGILGQ